jgi:hypothetical protein
MAQSEPDSRSTRRHLPPLTPLRLERLAARVRLIELSMVSGISPVVLREAARGIRDLTPGQAEARAEALARLTSVSDPQGVDV